jgi:hypothetical protein
MQPSASTVSLLCALLAACCPDKPDDCVENDVTLTQGIYGQVLEHDDVVHDEDCKQYAQPRSYSVWLETADGTRVAEHAGMVTMPASGRTRYDLRTGVIGTYVESREPSRC